jgi:TusA-related sulfurtransferase
MATGNALAAAVQKVIMPSIERLDLTGVLPPICLLHCKKQLNKMAVGEVVCVHLKDQATAKDLALIIERSKDRIIKQQVDNGNYRIYIQKA